MSKPLHPLDQKLLVRFLSGEANEDEIRQVQHWMLSDEKNKAYMDEMSLIWETSQEVKDLIGIDKKGDWIAVKNRMKNMEADPVPTLTLSESNWPRRLMRIAAAIMLIAVTYFTWPVLTQYWQVTTFEAVDNTRQFQLPDGSTVYLNQGSRLSYHRDFNKSIREVELTGEAFFEVFEDGTKPFLVQSGQATTEVVGTSFNVKSTPSNAILVTVLTGKVQLYNSVNTESRITIIPGEQGLLKNGVRLSKSLNEDVNFLSWKTGELHFRNTGLAQVIRDLNRHYQKTIQVQPAAIDNCALTATFRQQKLEDVLDEIQLALSLEIEEKENTFIIKGTGCSAVP